MKLKERTEYLWHKYGFRPKKEWGQNFLIDPRIVDRIIESLDLTKKDILLEIGAGTGILTERLARKGGRVIAVEIDKGLCQILEEELKEYKNLETICQDIEKISFEERFHQSDLVKLVGNLPYHLASSLLLDLARKEWVKFMVVMVQKEVGERVLAEPGDKKRGQLTVLLNYYAEVVRIIDAPRQAFFPPPRVSSSLLRLERRKERYRIKSEDGLFLTVKAAFSSRRKMLANSLSHQLNIDKDLVKKRLSELEIDWKKRAEDLTVEEFARISNGLCK